MRKLFLASLILISPFALTGNPPTIFAQQKPIPPYAKWGSLAMSKTKERYPNAQIIDYLHIGRVQGTATSTEKFKLWLREGTREFGVFINITFENKTEKVVNITYRESPK